MYFLGLKQYKELEDGFEILPIVCPKCREHLVKINNRMAEFAFRKPVGTVYCVECAKYKPAPKSTEEREE